MNIEQLSQNLINCQIPKSRYRILVQGTSDNKVCLDKTRNGWNVYYESERGDVDLLKHFSDEAAACGYFWEVMLIDSHDRRRIEVGRAAGLVVE